MQRGRWTAAGLGLLALIVPTAARAEVTADPAAIDFGIVVTGDVLPAVSQPRTVTLRNTGSSLVRLGAVTLPGSPRLGPFELQSTVCRDRDLDPGATCTATVRTAAYESGIRTDALTFIVDGASLTVPLRADVRIFGLPPPRCTVPKVLGLSLRQATIKIRSAGCRVGRVSRPCRLQGRELRPLTVRRQSPGAGRVLTLLTPRSGRVHLQLAERRRR